MCHLLALPVAGVAGTFHIAAEDLIDTEDESMTEQSTSGTDAMVLERPAIKSLVDDWSEDKQAFQVPWGKAMMWIFLLSDTFIFSCFLTGYMNVRISTTEAWPNPSEVFALTVFGEHIPLILIAIMTFVLNRVQTRRRASRVVGC